MTDTSRWKERQYHRIPWMRLLGPIILIIIISRLDFQEMNKILFQSKPFWILPAIGLIIPLFTLKTIRWQILLKSQSIAYQFLQALLAYFSSLFIGFLTPGRLGEFSKVFYVRNDCGVTYGLALSSVLADRLFDLYFLLFWAAFAFLSFFYHSTGWLLLVVLFILMTVPMFLFLNTRTFNSIKKLGERFGNIGKNIFRENGGLENLRSGLRRIGWKAFLLGICLTTLAYGIYFSQCYFLAQSINLSVSFIEISFAVSLGGLVTLIPVSIAGLGTRDAAIVSYLGFLGIDAERALSFSLLVFANFYLIGSVLGFLAWVIKPIPGLFSRK